MTSKIVETAETCELVSLRADEYAANVLTVELDRPDQRNALNAQLRRELKTTFGEIDAADGINGVVLTGSKAAKAFASGGDVEEIGERTMLEQREALKRPRVYEMVDSLSVPVIARITGYALGGGCELALAADIRVARSDAVFGLPEIKLGIFPGGGGTQRLPRLVGEGQAMRLVLTGESIDASEAYEIGLTDFLCEDTDELETRIEELAEGLSNKSTIALETAKKAVRSSSRMGMDDGIEYEAELFGTLFATGEKNEGVAAFLENREPSWDH